MKSFFEKKLFAICCIFLVAHMAANPFRAAPRCQGKQRWPELVGTNGKTAAVIIQNENTNVTAVLCAPFDSLPACHTSDFSCNRVRVTVIRGFVAKTPTVG